MYKKQVLYIWLAEDDAHAMLQYTIMLSGEGEVHDYDLLVAVQVLQLRTRPAVPSVPPPAAELSLKTPSPKHVRLPTPRPPASCCFHLC